MLPLHLVLQVETHSTSTNGEDDEVDAFPPWPTGNNARHFEIECGVGER